MKPLTEPTTSYMINNVMTISQYNTHNVISGKKIISFSPETLESWSSDLATHHNLETITANELREGKNVLRNSVGHPHRGSPVIYVNYQDGKPHSALFSCFRVGKSFRVWKANKGYSQEVLVHVKKKPEDYTGKTPEHWKGVFSSLKKEYNHKYYDNKKFDSKHIGIMRKAGVSVVFNPLSRQKEVLAPIASDLEGDHITGGQRITEEGLKRTIKHTRHKDMNHNHSFLLLNKQAERDVIYIVEGLSDGVSLARAKGKMVAVAFGAPNVKGVGEALRRLLPTTDIIVVPDNDGAGIKAARDTARNVSNVFIHWLPANHKDIDDYRQRHGDDGIRGILQSKPIAPYDNEGIKPTRIINRQYLEQDIIEGAAGFKYVFLQTPQGTGKTTLVNSHHWNEDSFLALSHRKTLASEQARKAGMEYYLDADIGGENEPTRVAIVDGSLWKYKGNPRVLLIEEAKATLYSIFIGRHLRHKEKSVRRLLAMIKKADRVYFSDADIDLDFIKMITELLKLEQNDIYWLVNNYRILTGKPVYSLTYRSDLIDTIDELLESGKRVIAPIDSLAFTQELYSYFKKRHPGKRILLINSKRTEFKEQLEFVKNPNKKEERYDLVIHSPTITSGIDIEEGMFDAVCGSFRSNSITQDDITQMLLRLRGLAPIYALFPGARPAPTEEQEMSPSGIFRERNNIANKGEDGYIEHIRMFKNDPDIANFILTGIDVRERAKTDYTKHPVYRLCKLGCNSPEVIMSKYTKQQAAAFSKEVEDFRLAIELEEEIDADYVDEEHAEHVAIATNEKELVQLEKYNLVRRFLLGVMPESNIDDVIRLHVSNPRAIGTWRAANRSDEHAQRLYDEECRSGTHELNRTYPALNIKRMRDAFRLLAHALKQGRYDLTDPFIIALHKDHKECGLTTAEEDGRIISFANALIRKTGLKTRIITGAGKNGHTEYALTQESVDLLKQIMTIREQSERTDRIWDIVYNLFTINIPHKDRVEDKTRTRSQIMDEHIHYSFHPPPS